jgi:hypothetical protein
MNHDRPPDARRTRLTGEIGLERMRLLAADEGLRVGRATSPLIQNVDALTTMRPRNPSWRGCVGTEPKLSVAAIGHRVAHGRARSDRPRGGPRRRRRHHVHGRHRIISAKGRVIVLVIPKYVALARIATPSTKPVAP